MFLMVKVYTSFYSHLRNFDRLYSAFSFTKDYKKTTPATAHVALRRFNAYQDDKPAYWIWTPR